MTVQSCLAHLDTAIALSRRLKNSIVRGRYRLAIDLIADILLAIGQTFLCINRLEVAPASGITVSDAGGETTKNAPSTKGQHKTECLLLVDIAIANFELTKVLIITGKYEEAENVLASTLTGRILRCVNHLRTLAKR